MLRMVENTASDGPGQAHRKGDIVLNILGLALSVLCIITGLWHQQTVGWDADKTLLTISFIFAFTHCAYYMLRVWKQSKEIKPLE